MTETQRVPSVRGPAAHAHVRNAESFVDFPFPSVAAFQTSPRPPPQQPPTPTPIQKSFENLKSTLPLVLDTDEKRRALGPAIQALIPQAFQYDFGQLMERLTYPGRSASEVGGARPPRWGLLRVHSRCSCWRTLGCGDCAGQAARRPSPGLPGRGRQGPGLRELGDTDRRHQVSTTVA